MSNQIIEDKPNEKEEPKKSLKIGQPSNQNEIDTILSGCADLYPLKFVDTIETLYHTIINKTEYKSLNTLSNYKENNDIIYSLIEINKAQPSPKIIEKMKNINCIKVTEEYLFTGDNNGFVYMYEIKRGLEMEGFGVKGKNSPVSVIENKGNDHLLVGYENGTINLFDIKKVSLIKSIIDIHKSKILALKLISIEKSSFQFISSDEDGQVIFVTSSNSFLSKKTTGNVIYQDNEPTYAITKFKPYDSLKLSLLAFASPTKVRLYTLEPKLLSIFEIKKPAYVESNDIPDISMGWGICPVPEGTSHKKLLEMKRDREILLALGWGNAIVLYKIIVKGENAHIKEPIGFFANNNSIVKLGFFSSSIIYFFDCTGQIRVLNTAFFNYGDYDENKLDNQNALIDNGKILDKNMKYNNISKEKDKELLTYRNFIYNMKKCIYLFSSEGLRMGKILDYQECIENIIKQGKYWKSAMCLAIDIYKGNIINFPGIPLDENERKKKLRPYLIELLNKYIDYIFNLKSKSISENDIMASSNEDISEIKDDEINECITVSIEFCLEIKEFDYLLKDVETTFNTYGKGDLFYTLFESFIFNDNLLEEEIGVDALTSFFGAYKIKNELVLLSHLFTHINIKSLNNFMIKKLAVKENLFNLIIFIFSNGDCSEDFFYPISKMYNAYIKGLEKASKDKEENKEKDEHKYYSYYNLYVKRGIKGINEMEKSKEYIGHKLLWYIQMCLKGNKYASGTEADLLKFQIGSENYKKFVAYIYFWILQEDIFKTLLEFDSYSLFSVLSLFFSEPKIMKIIKNYDFSTINADIIEKLVDDQVKNLYLMKNMNMNTFGKSLTMTKDTKADNNLQQSKTILPGKSNIKEEILKGNKDLNEIKEESNEENAENEKDKEENKEKEKENNEQNENKKEENKNENEIVEDKKEKEKEKPKNVNKVVDPNFDPFETPSKKTQFGKGVKLNDLNSVLGYIIKIVNSHKGHFSHLDLYTFLIRYASKCEDVNSIPRPIRNTVLEGFIACLKFFTEYQMKRKDLISLNEDKFNIHSLSKKILDSEDSYFIDVSNLLNDLLNSKEYRFEKTELDQLKDNVEKTQFTMIKIRIYELLKEYEKCLDIFIEEKNQKLKENVFTWIDDKFQSFIEMIEEDKKSKKNKNEINKENPKENEKRLIAAIISRISQLAQIRLDKAKKIVGKYFDNKEKLFIYNNLKEQPEIQFEFLEQLLYQPLEQFNEENINYVNDDEQNIDLFKLYLENMKDKVSTKEEKKVREQFHKLLIEQIHLLISIQKKSEVYNYVDKNIKLYTNYPLRDALRECIENDIVDTAVFIFKILDENKNALRLTINNLEESFKKYITKNIDNKEFLDKLQFCINICKENSESLLKRVTNETDLKSESSEGKDLWFELLKKLYELEGLLETNKEIKDEAKKKEVQNTLQKSIEDLLKEICSYVSIQNLVEYVTDKQERAQYKEFKSILESMLRSNTSFERVISSVIIILQDSIENSESKRKKATAKGSIFNYKKCDVCEKYYKNSPNEVINCFGCGHQSHKNCIFLKKEKEMKNKNVINTKKEDYESNRFECVICHKNRLDNMNAWENAEEEEQMVQKISDEEEGNQIKDKSNNKTKFFKFGNKNNKLSRIDKYDHNYDNEVSMFY